MSNFPCSLTRNITSHSMENMAFHSLLRRKIIILPTHYLTYTFSLLKVGRMYVLSSGLSSVDYVGVNSEKHWVVNEKLWFLTDFLFSESKSRWPQGRKAYLRRVPLSGSLSTRTGDHDGNVSETIKLIAEDKRSTWICEIDMISGSTCLTCDFNCFIMRLLSGRGHHFDKWPQSLFSS